jgi:hypothetical protein
MRPLLGEEAIVESPGNAFPPLLVHYPETPIVPAAVRSYRIPPHGPQKARSAGRSKRLSVPVREHMNSPGIAADGGHVMSQHHDGRCHQNTRPETSFSFASCALSRTGRGRITGNTKRETY